MKILLDTNAYSAMVRGHDEVCARVRDCEQMIFSTVVLGELLAGFHHGSRYAKNRQELDEYLASPHVFWVPVTLTTADLFGRLWTALKARGKPIPTNDIWIAAHTIETDATLLSFDRHFDAVEDLRWVYMESSP